MMGDEKLTRKVHPKPVVIDETNVKSFGAVPLDFDQIDEAVLDIQDIVMKRGVI